MPAVSAVSRRNTTVFTSTLVLLMLLIKKRKQVREQRQPRRWWIRPVFLARKQEGLYHTAMKRMREGDHGFFFKFYRMTPALFDVLLRFVALDLTKIHVSRETLEPGERLAITLSYLASGQDIPSVALAYRVGIETARLCIHETCEAIWERLKDHVMKTPTKADWHCIAKGFHSRWQFPNCLGAVDGKHVAIVCPPKSGSKFFNYKGTFSIVLMAVVDSDCKYVLVDVGAEGRQSDGGIFKESSFGCDLSKGRLDIPAVGTLPGTSTCVPYAFVGDEAFQLRKDFMRPYPAKCLNDTMRIFNYRLSRARRCAENAFGITAARWRILLRTINVQPSHVDFVVKAACVLHNFLTLYNPHAHQFLDREDSFGNVVGGRWRHGVQHVPDNSFFAMAPTQARNYDGDAGAARRLFASYFSSTAGQVPWQWNLPGLTKKQPS
nr:protein ANTAGONIST OF LIKE HETEROCHROMATIN PROTEIN 1-like [Rhipicephalus microplus]